MSILNSTAAVDITTALHKVQYDADVSNVNQTAHIMLNKKNAQSVPVHVDEIDSVCAALQRIKGIIRAVEPPAPAVIDGVSEVFASKSNKSAR